MTHPRPALLITLLLFFTPLCIGSASAQAPDLEQEYAQVVRPTPDLTHVFRVANLNFQKDALQFHLLSGSLALTQPVHGKVAAAIFVGEGELRVEPPNPTERGQMLSFTGEPHIALPFTQAVFRFGDATAFLAALGSSVKFAPGADAGFGNVVQSRAKDIEEEGLSDAAAVLQSIYAADPVNGLWLVDMKSDRSDWVQASFDPLQTEEVRVHQYRQGAKTGLQVFDDTWTQFVQESDRKSNVTAAQKHPELLQFSDYHLDVTVPGNLDMTGDAAVTLNALQPVGRGVLLYLDSNLRILDAKTADGQPLATVQPRDPKRFRSPRYFGDWLYVQLPSPLAAGAKLTLDFRYHGKNVVTRVGDGNFFCRSSGWYPSYEVGAVLHRSNYDIVFHTAKKNTVVATGAKVRDEQDGKDHVTEWKSEVPLPEAGFAMGEYKVTSAEVPLPDGSKTLVQVYSNIQPDDFFRAVSTAADTPSEDANGSANSVVALPPGLQNLNTVSLAPKVLQEVSNALRVMDAYFGPYPYSKLAVSNIPYSYGQGWPSLLYLTSLSFLDPTQLHGLGVGLQGQREFSDTFRAHETSHQWWGNAVGWETAHDQWLSEGFAEASSLLYETIRFGQPRALETLEQWRRDLLVKDQYGVVANQLGPLWLGARLRSSHGPTGYDDVVYMKGGYVLYMLREMLYNPGAKTPDGAFMALMHDFTKTFYNQNASTEDFKTVAERHMLPIMNLDGNGKLDWFFNEYVYGTGIPLLKVSNQVTDAGGGKFDLAITVHQDPGDWKGLLPIYLYRDASHWGRGLLPVTKADQTIHIPLPFRPVKVVANQFDDMLIGVEQ
mgnify:CR=1 FL=1